MKTIQKLVLFTQITFSVAFYVFFITAPITYAIEPSGGGSVATGKPIFKPLAGIPGFTDSTDRSLPGLVQTIYRLSIILGAVAAALKITWAGFQYMSSDSIGNKEHARDDIQSALTGLIILLSTVLILRTISGNVSLDPLATAPFVNMDDIRASTAISTPAEDPANKIDPTFGCGQGADAETAGTFADSMRPIMGGRSCSEGKQGVLQQGKFLCTTDPNATIPGQNIFKGMTLKECLNTSTTGENLIMGGQKIQGMKEITVGEIRNLYPGITTEMGKVNQYITDVAQSACNTAAGGTGTVNITSTGGIIFTQNLDATLRKVSNSDKITLVCTTQ